jgi:hypothetical protein
MEARDYKMLAPIYQITRRRSPEDRILHVHLIATERHAHAVDSELRTWQIADDENNWTNSQLLFVTRI